VKRDSAGNMVKREKRVKEQKGRKRLQSVTDNDRGISLDSGDETDLAEHLGLLEAIPATTVASNIVEDEVGAMSLGAQGDALLAAINASLGAKIDGVSSQVAGVASRVEVVENQLISTNRAVEHQGAQLTSLDLRTSTLERGKTATGADGFCGGADPWQRFNRTAQPTYQPQVGGGAASNYQLHAGGSAAASSGGRPESVASGGATSAFSATGEENDLSRVLEDQFRLPIKRRRLVVLGGAPPQYGKGTDSGED
jgi:hypothetical protein